MQNTLEGHASVFHMFEFLFEHGKLLLFGFNVLVFAFVLISTRKTPAQSDDDGSVLLVTAHPDDEVMFFAPLLKALRWRKVHILCLSGSNQVREKEFAMSCGKLGVSTWSVGKFVDGFDQTWDVDQVATAIGKQAQKMTNLKSVITFDNYGVSGHPNHIACWSGCVALANSLPVDKRPNFLFLQSVGLIRKYLGLMDAVASVVFGSAPFFLSFDPFFVWRLMEGSYSSQFVWFRRLYVLFSRFVFINTFQLHAAK